MMKFDKEPEAATEDLINLTSMIDVVFTLLAFFIIGVRVFGAERDAVVGAERSAAPAGIVKGDLPQSVTVRLAKDPNGGAMYIELGSGQYTDPAAITARLRQINLPDVPVVFDTDPNLSVEQVTGAVDAALQSPMHKVSLRRSTK